MPTQNSEKAGNGLSSGRTRASRIEPRSIQRGALRAKSMKLP
jgi:hypothetical protein